MKGKILKGLLSTVLFLCVIATPAAQAIGISVDVGDQGYYTEGPSYWHEGYEYVWVPGHWGPHHHWIHGHYNRHGEFVRTRVHERHHFVGHYWH